ncbi:hypothetical protein JTF08_06035 [Micrococcaceae bacterium RIT802]|nr:hypothetical protein [Micrococcaceae bacterium RIT 802]
MTSTTAKTAPPQPSFHYETTMASRRAFRQPGSSAWPLADATVAQDFVAASGWTDPVLPSAGAPALLRFWCFYGVIGLIAQGDSANSHPLHWFTPDGAPANPATWALAEGVTPLFTDALVSSVGELSRQVPSAFLRIDLLVEAGMSRVAAFGPKPAEASRLNTATDRRLGQLAVDAAGRLHHDLVNGSRFPAFTAAVERAASKTPSEDSVPSPTNQKTAGVKSSMPVPVSRTSTTSAMPRKNYATWRLPHVRWASIEDFAQSLSLSDGVHSILLPAGVCVDVYVSGDPFAGTDVRPVLTFFAGAVTGREAKTGPFFTGLGIAKALC